MRLKTSLAAAALAILTACGPINFAENTTLEERTLTVREIDRENRNFAVTGDGQRFNVRVSEAVVNFDQIEVGDRVNMSFERSVTVAMAAPGDTGETIAAGGTAVAPEGARPAAVSGEIVSAVVTFVAYDPRSHDATLRTEDGRLLITRVPRELRRFAASRVPGDRVAVQLTEAFAVAVVPAP